ncbi:hypothetical protein GGR54DRAFT_635870 [Hypoxylon sp. NC1633]|nr:hypothetical protein GGR54DRAFT_635870 [Hypoxylon sp. NC1633]
MASYPNIPDMRECVCGQHYLESHLTQNPYQPLFCHNCLRPLVPRQLRQPANAIPRSPAMAIRPRDQMAQDEDIFHRGLIDGLYDPRGQAHQHQSGQPHQPNIPPPEAPYIPLPLPYPVAVQSHPISPFANRGAPFMDQTRGTGGLAPPHNTPRESGTPTVSPRAERDREGSFINGGRPWTNCWPNVGGQASGGVKNNHPRGQTQSPNSHHNGSPIRNGGITHNGIIHNDAYAFNDHDGGASHNPIFEPHVNSDHTVDSNDHAAGFNGYDDDDYYHDDDDDYYHDDDDNSEEYDSEEDNEEEAGPIRFNAQGEIELLGEDFQVPDRATAMAEAGNAWDVAAIQSTHMSVDEEGNAVPLVVTEDEVVTNLTMSGAL